MFVVGFYFLLCFPELYELKISPKTIKYELKTPSYGYFKNMIIQRDFFFSKLKKVVVEN